MRNPIAEELEWVGGRLDRKTAVNAGRVAGLALPMLASKPLQPAAAVSFSIFARAEAVMSSLAKRYALRRIGRRHAPSLPWRAYYLVSWIIVFILFVWVFDFGLFLGSLISICGLAVHVYSEVISQIKIPEETTQEQLEAAIQSAGYLKVSQYVYDINRPFLRLKPERIYLDKNGRGTLLTGPYSKLKKVAKQLDEDKKIHSNKMGHE